MKTFKRFFFNKRGSAWAFLVILIAIFATGLVYVIFTQVFMGVMVPSAEQYLGTVTFPNGSAYNTSQALNTIYYIKTVWNWWPLIAIIGFIITAFIMAQRREPGQYYY